VSYAWELAVDQLVSRPRSAKSAVDAVDGALRGDRRALGLSKQSTKERIMAEVTTIGLDIAKRSDIFAVQTGLPL
jgi:hypothetical protein